MDKTDLSNKIVDYLKNYKAYEIKGICKKYGIECDENLDPMNSKRVYIQSGLISLGLAQLREIAKTIIKEEQNPSFVKSVEPYLSDDFFDIKMATRRELLNWIVSNSGIEGKLQNFHTFVSQVWDLQCIGVKIFDGTLCKADEFILQHMVRNNDITYQECLEDYLDFMYVSDDMICKFLEILVDPNTRYDYEQESYVTEINKIIGSNGFRLVQNGNIAGNPTYKIERFSNQGVDAAIHNIIFGACGVKPDIVIEDALSNKLRIIGDTSNCLFYNHTIGTVGLSWRDMIVWWNQGEEEYTLDTQKELVSRFKASLDSEPEKIFLTTYYNSVYCQKNDNLPALIPQVYCHYDPKSAGMRKGKLYVVQRMDFLMLLPDGVRIIIEIDGKQHYSEEDKSSPSKYAEMVESDRKLKLYGYEVFRFGGYEFLDDNHPRDKINDFLQLLFRKYGLL